MRSNDNSKDTGNYRLNTKINKRKERFFSIDEDDSLDNSKKNKNISTNDKLTELQIHNYSYIRVFIVSYGIYGKDVY